VRNAESAAAIAALTSAFEWESKRARTVSVAGSMDSIVVTRGP
jgi:hypothetical protein